MDLQRKDKHVEMLTSKMRHMCTGINILKKFQQ